MFCSMCDKPAKVRGFCRQHYIAARRNGICQPKTIEERFSEKFEIDKYGCWIWTGTKDGKGYPMFSVNGKNKRAHRWVWETYVEPLNEGDQIHHLCDKPSCVNLDHLEPMDNAENQNRRWARKHRCSDCGSTNIKSIGDLDLTIT